MVKTSKDDGGSVTCFWGNILRRILCSGSLPTHPCDQFIISEPKIVQFDHSSDDQKVVNSSPGLVARLMGLESLPVQRTFGSFLRSRSVSSLETYMPQLDLAEKFHHRRVRTSVSFREILTFDQEKLEPEKSCICRKLDVCRKQNVRKQRNKSKRIVSNRVKPLFNSEDTRSQHIQTATPDNTGKVTGKVQQKFTILEYLNNYASTGNVQSKEINKEADYYVKALGEICRLAEEAVKTSCWVGGGGSFMFEGLQDLCIHFEQQLLDQLINQVVHELASSS